MARAVGWITVIRPPFREPGRMGRPQGTGRKRRATDKCGASRQAPVRLGSFRKKGIVGPEPPLSFRALSFRHLQLLSVPGNPRSPWQFSVQVLLSDYQTPEFQSV